MMMMMMIIMIMIMTLVLRILSAPVHTITMLPRTATLAGVAVRLSSGILPRSQVRRIGREDAQFGPEAVSVPDGFLAMGLGEGRVRQAGPRLEEGRRRGTAGALDARHGGSAFPSRAGGRRRRGGRGGGAASFPGCVPVSILG